MSGASRLKKASISAPKPTPLFESPTINKGKRRKRRLSSKLKAMEIGEDESDGNFASHKSKKLRTLKNTRHSEDVEVFKYTKEEVSRQGMKFPFFIGLMILLRTT